MSENAVTVAPEKFVPPTQEQLNQALYDQGVNIYKATRQEGDIDLVQMVRDELATVGLEAQLAAHFDNDQNIIDAKTKVPEVQRYLLNRFLNHQLRMSGTGSIEARSYLLTGGSLDHWFALFKDHVVPYMYKNNLPKEH